MKRIQISEDSIKQHGGQLGAEVANNIKKCLREDLKNLAVSIPLPIFVFLSFSRSFLNKPKETVRWFKICMATPQPTMKMMALSIADNIQEHSIYRRVLCWYSLSTQASLNLFVMA